MKKLSNVGKNKNVQFWDVIDPDVSWEFLIGIFLSIFNREIWLSGLKYVNQKNIEDTTLFGQTLTTLVLMQK